MNIVSRAIFRYSHKITKPISGHVIHNSLRTRVIVVAGQELLLIKTSFGTQKWSLPGGGVHKHENVEVGAARELMEEAGVEVDPTKLKRLGEKRLPKNKKWPVANIRFYTIKLSTKPASKVTRPFEIMDCQWFSLNNLPVNRSDTVDEGLKLL